MITCGYRKALPFSLCKSLCKSNMLRHIYELRHSFDSSLPLKILLFFCNCILVFGHMVLTFFIMSLNDFRHIVHVTGADFNRITAESFVEVASWKMFCYQLKEYLCNVCWNGFPKGWVTPYYVLLLDFLFLWFAVGVFKSIL